MNTIALLLFLAMCYVLGRYGVPRIVRTREPYYNSHRFRVVIKHLRGYGFAFGLYTRTGQRGFLVLRGVA